MEISDVNYIEPEPNNYESLPREMLGDVICNEGHISINVKLVWEEGDSSVGISSGYYAVTTAEDGESCSRAKFTGVGRKMADCNERVYIISPLEVAESVPSYLCYIIGKNYNKTFANKLNYLPPVKKK